MFRLRKFTFVAAPLLCVLLFTTNAGASQNRDDSIDEAVELNNQAVDCVKDHQYQQAVDLLKKAITLRPDHAMAHYNLGRIYQMRNELNLAIEEYKYAVELNPNFVDAFYQLGISYNTTERFDAL